MAIVAEGYRWLAVVGTASLFWHERVSKETDEACFLFLHARLTVELAGFLLQLVWFMIPSQIASEDDSRLPRPSPQVGSPLSRLYAHKSNRLAAIRDSFVVSPDTGPTPLP